MPFYIRLINPIGKALLVVGAVGGLGMASWFANAADDNKEGLDITLTANIVENTCQISISGNGTVHLPTVSRRWFYHDDGTSRLQPGDPASGTLFSVNVESCSGDAATASTLTFGFQPQNGVWPAESQQVFINETSAAAGGAENVGIVIFSTRDNRNVVNSDGSSAVVIDVSKMDNYLASYDFYARYQNTGAVTPGKVNSHVLVDAIYQ
ncbi:fimbrial-like protein [Klebsiella michiganensis]|uniref:fimbrial-like protein n=1 Tax=Klebsiella michiganensis TaxID=1134687 RepID=UPI001CCFD4E8|nr:fimbrial-like protein [Klebsiella michiganensis]MCZ0064192.1 fimbrial-like protein [Klebsiella michiganensis]MCZ0080193.1 fimbrial-like protein [Klebsiella michiganensis]MDG9771577.1 fimbrial-like protein [Klebsiella michiganensis]MDH0948759.1 fimbrial-like protein [Klebsiella michiganensis]MDH1033459.1 fimbrial-like protein [Klebsiella michiganensis]